MSSIKKILSVLLTLTVVNICFAQKQDEFLTELYDSLHDSPMQQKFKRIAPMPYGVVFLPWAGCTEQDMREHFRLMKKLGFTNLKQTMDTPEWSSSETLRIALEEGIIPFWYGEGGWEDITTELLKKLKLPANMSIQEARKNPVMLAYQQKVLQKQLEGLYLMPHYDSLYDHQYDQYLREADLPLFREWVKNQYKTIEELSKAWNQYEVGIRKHPYKSWSDFDKDPLIYHIPYGHEIVPKGGNEYGKARDIMRFKADMYIENVKKTKQLIFPEQPQRAGGEMGLFLPYASRGTDMEGIADVMTEVGVFYPSIHLAWHFEETDYEVTRCIYMQSSICTDWFKGGWASTIESTGGPQQFSGGKGWTRKAQETTPGYTVNGGTMTQLLLSYIAGGFKGVGLWSWNPRMAGWESGEYALLDRQNQPSERAIIAGKIAQAADKYRDELWKAHKEPTVGVLVNWDNEAIWSAVAGPNRTHFKNYPIQARVGISRALIDANVEWEHVTPTDLRKGLSGRYKVIYLPAQIAINEDLFPIFEKYVKDGGRLVLDAPGAWWNERGLLLNTGQNSPFERIFGCMIRDFQYANNVTYTIGSHSLNGFYMDLKPTTGTIIESTKEGHPLVIENKLGKGTAVVLANDASFSMKNKGNDFIENWTVKVLMGKYQPVYTCENAIVYRLAAPQADHYFFMNDGPAVQAIFTPVKFKYKRVCDAITGEELKTDAPVHMDAYSGRWLRFEK